MNCETLLDQISARCDTFRADLIAAAHTLRDFTRRLDQIILQLHKDLAVRDDAFAGQFNQYCQELRQKLDEAEPFWTQTRNQARTYKDADWTGDLALAAKGLNSRAKTLSRACDEFTTAYDAFCRSYNGFTAAKLNAWLLTSCQNDAASLTGKILFLAREIAKKTERNRGPHVYG